jgi:type IV pilus assembly protein PilY1
MGYLKSFATGVDEMKLTNIVRVASLLALVVALTALAAAPASAQAVITNGSVALGVNPLGHLNAPSGGSGISPVNSPGSVGVAFFADYDGDGDSEWGDATAPGCLCEGFGVSADATFGWANVASGGSVNLSSDSFVFDADSAVSTAHLTSLAGLSIVHDYHPSSSSSLYEAVVTITNGTGADIADLRYRRVMDWDIPPTTFDELVTIQGAGLGDLDDVCNDGFEVPNPLLACSGIFGIPANTNFVDLPAGGADHGASFTFGFGALAAGASKTFSIFYGAAATEAAALAALGAVGAEGIYSFGQNSGPTGGSPGTPATFIFGFGGVGAPPISTVPEPATASLLLIGGLAGMVARYRKS